MRHAVGARRHEHRRARHARRGVDCRGDEDLGRHRRLAQPLDHQRAALGPGRQDREHDQADHQREPAAIGHLGEVRRQIGSVDQEEEPQQRRRGIDRPVPQSGQRHPEQAGVDEHRPRHRNAIGRGQIGRRAEEQHQQDDHRHQQPVHQRDVDLPHRRCTGVLDAQPRHEAELDRLLRHREGAGDHRLAGDDRRHRGQDHQRQLQVVGGEHVERAAQRRLALAEQQRPLPQIIAHQRRQHEDEPRQADRLAPEMPHIGIERLRPRHREHHRTERQKSPDRIGEEEVDRVVRRERPQYVRRLHDAEDTQHRDHAEIDEHDRPEHQPDPRGAAALDPEERDEDDEHQRQHQPGKRRRGDRQPFDRAEHGDGRRDHRIAIEERRREHAEQHDPRRPAATLRPARHEREQRQAAAFAIVVGAHDDRDVFDRDDDHHRPEHQAQHAHDVERIERQLVMPGKGFAEGVQRAGADVAEDDADRADRQFQQAIIVMDGYVVLGTGIGRSGRYGVAHTRLDRSVGTRPAWFARHCIGKALAWPERQEQRRVPRRRPTQKSRGV